jgi:hypothetical protein
MNLAGMVQGNAGHGKHEHSRQAQGGADPVPLVHLFEPESPPFTVGLKIDHAVFLPEQPGLCCNSYATKQIVEYIRNGPLRKQKVVCMRAAVAENGQGVGTSKNGRKHRRECAHSAAFEPMPIDLGFPWPA